MKKWRILLFLVLLLCMSMGCELLTYPESLDTEDAANDSPATEEKEIYTATITFYYPDHTSSSVTFTYDEAKGGNPGNTITYSEITYFKLNGLTVAHCDENYVLLYEDGELTNIFRGTYHIKKEMQ